MSIARMRRVARSAPIQPVNLPAPRPPPTAAQTDDPIIAAHDVVKRYDGTTAVAGLDLIVWPGEIFGILGPNGAGKTTTLEMLEGLRAPDQGTIRVAGLDPVKQPNQVHQIIGVQLQTTALFDYLTCAELVALFAALYRA
ncbi:MAG TPA: ATP-binding cassette domain-containing protein, partial [Miltoncostaeaceae bacterium]|nr:ATP-binding cassette domain-containing protein [Miltoncostaeaceae bacterium]